MFKRLISLGILVNFILSSVIPNTVYAQALTLPAPGTMVGTSEAYTPVILKGLQVKPANPVLFDFIVDTGDTGLKAGKDDAAIRAESQKLIKYFLASLTLPEKDQWVNLSPYEKDRMMTEELEKTELGRDMLAQDYILKQVTASLIHPEKELGKQFWAKVYAQAAEKFGSAEIPVDTFNKVWVVADKADVYVNKNTAFVVGSHLKVMLESDYLAATKGALADSQELAKQVVREIVLPALEAEVNTGKNFANLRQIFHSMILATWYKQNLKEALLNQVYSDKAKTNGVERNAAELDPQTIFTKYVEAYKKGVFNFIKEDTTATGETLPRKYFSGGVAPDFAMKVNVVGPAHAEVGTFDMDNAMRISVQMTTPDAAMKVTSFVIGNKYLAAQVYGLWRTIDNRKRRISAHFDPVPEQRTPHAIALLLEAPVDSGNYFAGLYHPGLPKDVIKRTTYPDLTTKELGNLRRVSQLIYLGRDRQAAQRIVSKAMEKVDARYLERTPGGQAFMLTQAIQDVARTNVDLAMNHSLEEIAVYAGYRFRKFEGSAGFVSADALAEYLRNVVPRFGYGGENGAPVVTKYTMILPGQPMVVAETGDDLARAYERYVRQQGVKGPYYFVSRDGDTFTVRFKQQAAERYQAAAVAADAAMMAVPDVRAVTDDIKKELGELVSSAPTAYQTETHNAVINYIENRIRQLLDELQASLPDAAMSAANRHKMALDRLAGIESLYRSAGISLSSEELVRSIGAEIKDRRIGLDEVSFIANRNGLAVIGPVNESAPQYFRVILPDKYRGDLITVLQGYADDHPGIQVESESLLKRTAYSIIIPPEMLPERREILRLLLKDVVKGPATGIIEGLEYEPEGLALTDSMERQAFVAQAEAQLLAGFEKSAKAAKEAYPELDKFFNDIQAGRPTKLVLTKELVKKWNLKEGLAKDLLDLARKAVAGLRETGNPLALIDLTKQMNILSLLFVCNELAEMSLEMVSKGEVPQAVIGGEVRYNTPAVSDMYRRRLAKLGFTVHSSKKGVYLPIGASSFITTIEDIIMALYDTSSHAARQVYGQKLNGPRAIILSEFERTALTALGEDPSRYERATSEGAQLLIDQMVRLAGGVAEKIDRVLETGEDLVFEFADANDPHIHFDLDNPEAGAENKDVSGEYARYLADSYINEAAVGNIKKALRFGMRYGFSQGNGASFGFNQRVWNKLIGEEMTGLIAWSDIHPDSFFNGTGMARYNPKKPKDNTIGDFMEGHQAELDGYFARNGIKPGFSMATTIVDTGKTVFIQVFPASAEKSILRPQGIRFITLTNGNLLAYYEPGLSDGSEDVSLLDVVMNSGLPAYLKDKPVGYIQATTDPDGDRFVVMQVEKNDKKTRERLGSLNIAFLELSDDKLLAVYVPNQNFFDIQGSLIDTLRERGEFRQDRDDFDEYKEVTFFGISTTASTILWRELWSKHKVPTVLVPVGFKEIARMEQLVEEQVNLNRIRERLGLRKKRVIIHDVFGQPVDLGYNPRLLFAGEESGGLVVGKKDLIESADKSRSFLAWREKSAVEANALFLKMIAEMFNSARAKFGPDMTADKLYKKPEFREEMSLSRQLQRKIEAQDSRNIAELRTDFPLIDPVYANSLGPAELKKYKDKAIDRRNANDAFWVSVAFAFEDGKISLDEAKGIIKDALNNDPEVLVNLRRITNRTEDEIETGFSQWIDDELTDIRFQGDGVYLESRSGGYAINRPSGTDPKLKGYPATNDAFISTLLSNGLVLLNPLKQAPAKHSRIFKAKGLGNYLDRVEVLARKQSQYERNLQMDNRVPWQGIVQGILNADGRFRPVVEKPDLLKPEMQDVSDVTVRLGPRKQAEALKFIPQASSIYVSWSFDNEMQKLSDQPEAVREKFAEQLASLRVDEQYGAQNFMAAAVTRGPDAAMGKAPGGIDLDAGKMTLDERGQKIDMTFDPAMIEQFRSGDFTGLMPVILNITPIPNIRPLLGLAPQAVGSPAADTQGMSPLRRSFSEASETVRRKEELS